MSTMVKFGAGRETPRECATSRPGGLAAFALASFVAATGISLPAFAAPPNPFSLPPERVLGRGDLIPDTSLVDQTGAHRSLRDFRGDTLVIGFIYTSCKDECPLVTAKFSALESRLPQAGFHLIEVTVDPERDTPRVLAAYAKTHHVDAARWTLLTGSATAIALFERALGVSAIDDGRGTIVHNDRTIIVDGQGTIADVIDEAGWTPDDIASDARNVAGLAANPLDRMDLALGQAVAYVCGGVVNGRTGLTDLVAVIAIFGLSAWAMVWVSRKFFTTGS
ncbi:MAG TPA: SCO family protein [Candidatus Eremiobacteraceae bacterium]|nr:SCO family protein [Candidatus Eremiobacteraceae bacterium]